MNRFQYYILKKRVQMLLSL